MRASECLPGKGLARIASVSARSRGRPVSRKVEQYKQNVPSVDNQAVAGHKTSPKSAPSPFDSLGSGLPFIDVDGGSGRFKQLRVN